MVMPPTRRVIAGAVRRWFEQQIASGRVHVYAPGYNHGPSRHPGVIDVEGEVVEVAEVVEVVEVGGAADPDRRLEK
jgi:hypothetical protein